MKVTNIRIERTERNISLIADCKIRPVGWDTIYFTFDKKYADWLVEDASPFAASLLIPCMMRNENLVINGSIPRTLYEGMKHIIDVMVDWNVGMKRIKIKAKTISEDIESPKEKNVATFFSGGVDSFYTFLKPRDNREDAITHFILINGNDIDLRNHKLWEVTRDNVHNIAHDANIQVVEVETNIQAVLESMLSPDFTHGGSLAAAGIALRNGFKKIYIPGSFSYEQIVPYGSHVDIDPYWGTKTLSFEHDGIEATRMQKVDREITWSPLPLKYLRVCYMNTKGAYNCGECEKCVRTMTALHAMGKLSEAKTFPHELSSAMVTAAVIHSGHHGMGYKDIFTYLRKKDSDIPLQAAIEEGLKRAPNKYPNPTAMQKLLKKMITVDHLYSRGKAYRIWLSITNRF